MYETFCLFYLFVASEKLSIFHSVSLDFLQNHAHCIGHSDHTQAYDQLIFGLQTPKALLDQLRKFEKVVSLGVASTASQS